jgi:hypothetical protein
MVGFLGEEGPIGNGGTKYVPEGGRKTLSCVVRVVAMSAGVADRLGGVVGRDAAQASGWSASFRGKDMVSLCIQKDCVVGSGFYTHMFNSSQMLC